LLKNAQNSHNQMPISARTKAQMSASPSFLTLPLAAAPLRASSGSPANSHDSSSSSQNGPKAPQHVTKLPFQLLWRCAYIQGFRVWWVNFRHHDCPACSWCTWRSRFWAARRYWRFLVGYESLLFPSPCESTTFLLFLASLSDCSICCTTSRWPWKAFLTYSCRLAHRIGHWTWDGSIIWDCVFWRQHIPFTMVV